LFSSLIVGIVAIIASLCFLDNILVALGATETILPHARAYAVIYIAGSILNIFNVTMNNIVTSEGAAKLTMISMLLGGGLNAILDPIFIYPLGFGIQGAAIATVVSQAATSLIYIWYISGKKGYLRFSPRNFAFDKTIYSQVFKVGIPTLIFQLLASVSIGLTNTAASSYGDSAVAAMGIVTRILGLGTFVIFGYMKGFQPVAGYNYGAKNYDRLNEATRVSLKWTTWFCGIMGLIMIVFPGTIVSFFSKNDAMVIDIGGRASRASGIMFIFFGFQMVYGSLFLALGKAKEGGILSISRQGIFFIPVILALPKLLGLNGVIYAQPVADLLTIILTAVFAIKLHKELNTLKNHNEEQQGTGE
jgi:putative MATE family efflux protein